MKEIYYNCDGLSIQNYPNQSHDDKLGMEAVSYSYSWTVLPMMLTYCWFFACPVDLRFAR